MIQSITKTLNQPHQRGGYLLDLEIRQGMRVVLLLGVLGIWTDESTDRVAKPEERLHIGDALRFFPYHGS
jgi:hypothetical protein